MNRLFLIFYFVLIAFQLFTKDFEFSGPVKSVVATQYPVILNNKNIFEFLPDKNSPSIRYIYSLDESGFIARKTISYTDIEIYPLEFLFEYYLSISENQLEIVGFPALDIPTFVYEDNINVRSLYEGPDLENFYKINDYYKNGRVIERDIVDSNNNLIYKIKFFYTSISKPITNTMIVKVYSSPTDLDWTYTFVYDKNDRIIKLSIDKNIKYEFIYNNSGKIREIFEYYTNETYKKLNKKPIVNKLTFTYNKKGFVSYKKFLISGKEKIYKYEYEYDTQNNPIIIKVSILKDYYGEKAYIPYFMQENDIEYF